VRSIKKTAAVTMWDTVHDMPAIPLNLSEVTSEGQYVRLGFK